MTAKIPFSLRRRPLDCQREKRRQSSRPEKKIVTVTQKEKGLFVVVVSGGDVSAPQIGAETSSPENVCGGSRGHPCTYLGCRDVLQPQPSTTRRPALLAPAGEWSSLQKKKLSPFWVTMTFFFAVVGVVDRVPPIKGGTLSTTPTRRLRLKDDRSRKGCADKQF